MDVAGRILLECSGWVDRCVDGCKYYLHGWTDGRVDQWMGAQAATDWHRGTYEASEAEDGNTNIPAAATTSYFPSEVSHVTEPPE